MSFRASASVIAHLATRQELPSVVRERPPDWARLVNGLDPLTAYVMTTRWEAAGGAAGMPEFYAAIFGSGGDDPASSAAVVDKKDDVRDRPAPRSEDAVEVGIGGGEGGGGERERPGSIVEMGGHGARSACGAGIGSAAGDEPDSDDAVRFGSEGDAEIGVAVYKRQAGSAVAEEATTSAEVTRKGTGGVADASPPVEQHQERGRCARRHHETVVESAGSEEVSGVALQERLVRLREAFVKEQCGVVLNRAVGW